MPFPLLFQPVTGDVICMSPCKGAMRAGRHLLVAHTILLLTLPSDRGIRGRERIWLSILLLHLDSYNRPPVVLRESRDSLTSALYVRLVFSTVGETVLKDYADL